MSNNLSRFMRKTLLPDEKVVADARFHAVYVFNCFLALSLCIVLGWVMQYVTWRYLGHREWMPVFAAAGVGMWLWFWMMLKMWTTEIVLTDQRLLYKRGFFSIDIDEVDVEQLASDTVHQSIIGRLLDFGAVHIRCIEANDIWLPPIAHPYRFRNMIEQQKHLYREHYMKVERLRHHGMSPGDR